MNEKKALISQLRGKFQAVGVLVTAGAIIAVASGMWWGAALLLPGVLLMLFGWL